jgi:hypothetical protein
VIAGLVSFVYLRGLVVNERCEKELSPQKGMKEGSPDAAWP